MRQWIKDPLTFYQTPWTKYIAVQNSKTKCRYSYKLCLLWTILHNVISKANSVISLISEENARHDWLGSLKQYVFAPLWRNFQASKFHIAIKIETQIWRLFWFGKLICQENYAKDFVFSMSNKFSIKMFAHKVSLDLVKAARIRWIGVRYPPWDLDAKVFKSLYRWRTPPPEAHMGRAVNAASVQAASFVAPRGPGEAR